MFGPGMELTLQWYVTLSYYFNTVAHKIYRRILAKQHRRPQRQRTFSTTYPHFNHPKLWTRTRSYRMSWQYIWVLHGIWMSRTVSAGGMNANTFTPAFIGWHWTIYQYPVSYHSLCLRWTAYWYMISSHSYISRCRTNFQPGPARTLSCT